MGTTNLLTILFVIVGVFFFITGTVGLLRFPDVYTRLHALTKADNLGLGLLLTGLAFQAESWTEVSKFLLIWFLVMLASASVAHLVARAAHQKGLKIWKK